MAKRTQNYGLIKPEGSDYYNIDDVTNKNADILDGALKAVASTADAAKNGIAGMLEGSYFVNPHPYSATFGSSGEWVCPAGCTKVDVWLVGAGGSGGTGGSSPTMSSGNGGGGGQCLMVKNVEVVPGSAYPIAVGTCAAGSDGGSTTAFGRTAPGGKSGQGSGGGDGGSGGGIRMFAYCRGGDSGQTVAPVYNDGSVYKGGRSLCSTLNPYDGKKYGAGGGGQFTGSGDNNGGRADVGSGGGGGGTAAGAALPTPGEPGGGGGGGGYYDTSKNPREGLGAPGGNGLCIIYYGGI